MENKICVWPDGTWCFIEELHEYNWKSDDFFETRFPEHLPLDDLDDYVYFNLHANGNPK